MTKMVPLSHGKVALVDDSDWEAVSKFRWGRCGGGLQIYAARSRHKEQLSPQYMHRFLLDEPMGGEVDHINGNGLDNRRENLRVVSHGENLLNCHNRFIKSHNTSGVAGISWNKRRRRCEHRPATPHGARNRKMIRCVLVVLALLLGGCAALGGAAGVLGAQVLTVGGQGTVRAIEEDIAAAQRWTGRHEAAVGVYMQSCLANAQRLAAGDDWPLAEKAFERCLEQSVRHMPTLLIERVKMRIDRSTREEAAEVQIEEEGEGPQIE